MKAKSTIQKQIKRLQLIAEDTTQPLNRRGRCYEAYHALRWVIENVDWSPAGLAEKEMKLTSGGGVT